MVKWLLILGPVYLAIMVVLAIISKRRVKNSSDFMMGGFNIGAILGFMTFAATLFSTFTLMGMPDFFRIHGVGAWIFLAVSDGTMVYFILWFGYRLRKKAEGHSFQGMAGFLSERYQSKWAGYLYLAGIFLFLIPYVSIQIRGISIFLDGAFQGMLPIWGWALIIVGIMIIYSETGGLKAIMYSDVLQGTLLLIVVWIIAGRFLYESGGLHSLFNEVERVNEKLLSVPGPKGLFTTQFLVASFIAIVLIPVTQPQISTRLMVMKNMGAMKKMSVAVGFFAIMVISATAIIGMTGAYKYPDLPVSEFLSRVLIKDHPDVIATIILIGLIAAAISTSDSQIFALGSELRSVLKGEEKKVMFITKLSMLVFAIFALIFSLISSDQLVMLARVSFAGTAIMGPMVLYAVYKEQKGPPAILVVTAIGILVFLLSLVNLVPKSIYGIQIDLLLFIFLFLYTLGIIQIQNLKNKYNLY